MLAQKDIYVVSRRCYLGRADYLKGWGLDHQRIDIHVFRRAKCVCVCVCVYIYIYIYICYKDYNSGLCQICTNLEFGELQGQYNDVTCSITPRFNA
jgi:hypothetical protein